MKPPAISTQLVGVEGPWSGSRDVRVNRDKKFNNLLATRHGVQLRLSDIPASREHLYYELPSEYNNNQLKSYGGFINYHVEFSGQGPTNDAPDIILMGNGYTLIYRNPSRLVPNYKNSVTAQIFARDWYKSDGTMARREEIMMTLASIEAVFIKLQFLDGGERNVELTEVSMDSAAIRDYGLGSASLVEQCKCPEGYSGLSCESCAAGYSRQRSGPWLGKCTKESVQCRPGTYGDPNRGIPCRPCPCPVPGNSHAATCELDRSGRGVVCHCMNGYTGPRCEECAPGYTGNPSSSGCYPIPASNCNPHGTERQEGGRCICKPDVVGIYCDQCASESFHLSESGCINCFCMGVTNNCSSSSLFRETVSSSFYNSSSTTSSPINFALVLGYDEPQVISDNLEVYNREIVFRHFGSGEDTYYWRLPSSYLGNKLTSYGGKLTYTLRYKARPAGGVSPSNSPDVVIQSHNKITLHHYGSDSGTLPIGPSTHSVDILESSWQHYNDGTSANRQHLLMALADIEAIYIKATYSTTAEEVALSQVSLDTATSNYRSNAQRAVEVEQCGCPHGHQGLSCESCSPGFYKGDGGLYLGLCEQCECNGHSDECDPVTGDCFNCRGNTEGPSCEQCKSGFTGNATDGGSCVEIESGNQVIRNCYECGREGTASCDGRRCQCKQNVVGRLCDQCREGTYGMSANNPQGCSECFCSGASSSCAAGKFYREQIPVFIMEGSPDTFSITDRDLSQEQIQGFQYDISRNEISMEFHDDSKTYYWNLPETLTGNRVLSYGGKLSITQRTEGSGDFIPDQDVILLGAGKTLFWSRRAEDLPEENYSVHLIESEWQSIQQTGPRPVSHSEFLTVLANLKNILVRASLQEFTRTSHISDITLDTAVSQPTPNGRMDDIEVCKCPAGYQGTSCEQCEQFHYRDVYDRSAASSGTCKRCPCTNAESCSLGQGRRIVCNCMPGYEGDMCQYPSKFFN